MELTNTRKKLLLQLARDAIISTLEKRELIVTKPDDTFFAEKRGLFVTLKQGEKLRGCIGYIKGYKPIWQAIIEMAKAAAFNDPRFQQLRQNDLDGLTIEISILSELVPVRNNKLTEITVGRDGLYIEGLFGSGLLLPQVAVEWNWDRDTFLRETCRKAGLSGDCYRDPSNQIYRFSAEIFSETSENY